jgi:hypothetical protein
VFAHFSDRWSARFPLAVNGFLAVAGISAAGAFLPPFMLARRASYRRCSGRSFSPLRSVGPSVFSLAIPGTPPRRIRKLGQLEKLLSHHKVSAAALFWNFLLFLNFWIRKGPKGGIMGRRWTDQDIDDLKRMAPIHPAPKIAEMIDRTVGGVVFKAHQLKVSLQSRRETDAWLADRRREPNRLTLDDESDA